MNAQAPMRTTAADTVQTTAAPHPAAARPEWLRALAGVALWALVLVLFQQGLQRGIGFSQAEAWTLAGSLMIMAGMLIGLLLVVGTVLTGDE
jgi:hypothetical protein